MSFSSRSYANPYIPSNRFPTGLKWLLIVNIGLFLTTFLLQASDFVKFFNIFRLVPAQVVRAFAIWQPVTYLFIHDGIASILWNMLALWMFGVAIERQWGTRKFLRYYFLCGVVGGLTVIAGAYLFGGTQLATAGSSSAVYGLLVAYAVLFPDQTLLFGFLIPMKSKYFVMIIGAVIFLQSYYWAMIQGGKGSGVAAVATLGGMVFGYLFLRGRRLRTRVRQPIEANYKDWKLRRAKKKFEVYLRKKDSDRDRWVH